MFSLRMHVVEILFFLQEFWNTIQFEVKNSSSILPAVSNCKCVTEIQIHFVTVWLWFQIFWSPLALRKCSANNNLILQDCFCECPQMEMHLIKFDHTLYEKSRRERWRHLMAPHFVTCGGALEHNGAAVATATPSWVLYDDLWWISALIDKMSRNIRKVLEIW